MPCAQRREGHSERVLVESEKRKFYCVIRDEEGKRVTAWLDRSDRSDRPVAPRQLGVLVQRLRFLLEELCDEI